MKSLWLLASAAAASVPVAHAQSFTTIFGPGGTPGSASPDASVLNGIEAFAAFGEANNDQDIFANSANIGEVLFLQVGPFYVGGAGPATSNPLTDQGFENLGGAVSNNRAYGVIGAGRSDIVFTPGEVLSISGQGRGSMNGQTTGSNPATSFGGVPTDLFDADAHLLIWTEFGVEVSIDLANEDYNAFSINASSLLGDSIIRLSIVNEGPANSIAALGELTIFAVPAPGAGLSLALGGLVACRRRRTI